MTTLIQSIRKFTKILGKNKIGASLIILFIIATAALAVLPVLYVFYCTGVFSSQVSLMEIGKLLSINKSTFFLITAAYVFVFFLIIFILKNKVYDPITKVEKMLHSVVKGETNFDFHTKKSDPFFSMFSDLNILFENIKILMLRESNAQLVKKQAELDALQSQINPHFLYNTLEAIRGQAMEYGIKDIELMTRALSRLFRYSISNHNTLVTLREELENVENYLYIQHLRFNNKFIKTSRIDEDAYDCKVPKLIIQPIVENAIYHGLEMKIGQGQICISAHLTKTRLVISIKDDGLGISESKLKELNAVISKGITQIEPAQSKNSSVGLRNVNTRIRLTYGKEYGINIYSTEKIGTEVQLSLPRSAQ